MTLMPSLKELFCSFLINSQRNLLFYWQNSRKNVVLLSFFNWILLWIELRVLNLLTYFVFTILFCHKYLAIMFICFWSNSPEMNLLFGFTLKCIWKRILHLLAIKSPTTIFKALINKSTKKEKKCIWDIKTNEK